MYWADGMIDWPRSEVTPYLVRPGNLALVARRQMLPTQPCNYFWITDQLLLDGLIRSDNRGSESVFPLFLEPVAGGSGPRYRINLDEAFLERAARQLGLRWQPDGEEAGDAFRADDLLYYSYALFFSPAYRLRYADRLWSDFPRVLLPRRPDLFREMAGFGERLAGRHLLRGLRSAASGSGLGQAASESLGDWRWSVAPRRSWHPASRSTSPGGSASTATCGWRRCRPRFGTFTPAGIKSAESGSKTAAAGRWSNAIWRPTSASYPPSTTRCEP